MKSCPWDVTPTDVNHLTTEEATASDLSVASASPDQGSSGTEAAHGFGGVLLPLPPDTNLEAGKEETEKADHPSGESDKQRGEHAEPRPAEEPDTDASLAEECTDMSSTEDEEPEECTDLTPVEDEEAEEHMQCNTSEGPVKEDPTGSSLVEPGSNSISRGAEEADTPELNKTSATTGQQPTTVGLKVQSDTAGTGVLPDSDSFTADASDGATQDPRVLRRSTRSTRGRPPNRYMSMLSNAVQLVKQVVMAESNEETGYDADSE